MVKSDKLEGDWEEEVWTKRLGSGGGGGSLGDKGFVCCTQSWAAWAGDVTLNIHPVTWRNHSAEEFCSDDWNGCERDNES